jgi:alpha-tubulin suppressor-like RCC1 family protein
MRRESSMKKTFLGWLSVALSWTTLASGAPVQVGGGEAFTCALGASGRAFCWGANFAGQVGNGAGMAAEVLQVNSPTEIAGGFVTISSSGYRTCGLQADGSAFCWGENHLGGVGNGTASVGTTPEVDHVSLPVRVQTSLRFQSISAGGSHTCAIDLSGEAWCWGGNDAGQLGEDPRLVLFTPSPVAVLANQPGVTQQFKAISAGVSHTCAIDTSGAAWCWGNNDNLRAGIDTNACGGVDPPDLNPAQCYFYRPVMTEASKTQALKFQSIAAGSRNTCAIDTSGNVQCWGDTLRGTATAPPSFDRASQVGSISNAVSVRAGATSVCAVAGNGGLFCWGSNDKGQLGNGAAPAFGAFSVTPVAVSGTQDYVAVSVGNSHACGRTSSNVLRCWGDNTQGQLGAHLLGANATSVPAVVGVSSADIAAGAMHTCSQDPTQVTACWGDNFYGQIGHGRRSGAPAQSVVPTPVARFFTGFLSNPRNPTMPESLSSSMVIGRFPNEAMSFSRLSVGGQHACVLNSSGTGYCWGADGFGQIGNGNRTELACRFSQPTINACVPAPTIVSRAATDLFSDVAAGAGHNCALDKGGIVRCWGSDLVGELGSPVSCASPPCFQRQPEPIVVHPPLNAVMTAVAVGDSSSCAINSSHLLCWGQIGGGATPVLTGATKFLRPRPLPFEQLGVGADAACVNRRQADLQCVGDNSFGQLGIGSNTPSSTLKTINGHVFSSFATSRAPFACGIAQGAAWCWGVNSAGQLGVATPASSNVPVQVALGSSGTAVGIGVGFAHACAIMTSGEIRCWGGNFNGEMGNGLTSPTTQNLPASVAAGWVIP